MSDLLWNRTQQLTGDLLTQVQDLYNGRFPMEVRHSIAEWIEQQEWSQVENDNDEVKAAFLLEHMVKQIKLKANQYTSPEMFTHRFRLTQSADSLMTTYQNDPLNLVKFVRGVLMRERQLVHMSMQESTAMNPENQMSDTERHIMSDMEQLRRSVMDMANFVKQQEHSQQTIVINGHRPEKLAEEIKLMADRMNLPSTTPDMRNKLTEKIKHWKQEEQSVRQGLAFKEAELNQLCQARNSKLALLVETKKRLCKNIFEGELEDWKELQKRATYQAGLCEAHILDKIQRWCEELAKLYRDCKNILIKSELLDSQLPAGRNHAYSISAELKRELQDIQEVLLLKSFVVDRQPPQVVRKDARFTANVRLLVGLNLNVFFNNPTVEAFIINEQQAKQIHTVGAIPVNLEHIFTNRENEISNNKGIMEGSQGQLSVTFRNMQLKRVKRADRKGTDLVVEEKFCLLFKSKVQTGKDHECEIWTMSLPIVVTVHGNQECQAQATILWDNSFSEKRRIPFVVPDQVRWLDLAAVLSSWFGYKVGASLEIDHLNYLGAKLFGENVIDVASQNVTRTQFHKDQMQAARPTPFWEWLYSIQKLTKDNLCPLWLQGSIMGFVSKRHAQELLRKCDPNTFLLRFSDTEPGGISIVYNEVGPDNQIVIQNLLPLTASDFRIRCLADRVKDLHVLQYLYPKIPKESAFGQYWSQECGVSQANSDDYVKHGLNMTINGMPMGLAPMSPAPSLTASLSAESQLQHPMSNMTMHSMDSQDYFPQTSHDFSDINLMFNTY